MVASAFPEVTVRDVELLWRATQEELSFQLAKGSYDTWIRNTVLEALDDVGTAYRVIAPSRLARDWLQERYAVLIEETLSAVIGNDITLSFEATEAAGGDAADDEDGAALGEDDASEPASVDLNPKFTFGAYVVGNHSRFAHAACRAVAESPGRAYNPLFIYGGVGLGKTHLMHAIGHAVKAKFRHKKVSYVTSEKFMNELIYSIQESKMTAFRNKYRTADVLLIDDIQFLVGRDRTQEEFFHTFNTLHEINRQIVISSDRPPRDIPTDDRIRSRFEWGLIADIQPPDYETRLAILRSKLGPNEEMVPEDVLSYMAHRIQHNIRELEGALTRVLAYAAIHRTPLTEEGVAELLKDVIRQTSRRTVTIERVQEVVSEYYNVSIEEMKGKRRDKHIVFPRQVAMYIIREEIASSLPAIGQAFGGRDHTTVLHSYDKISDAMQEEGDVRRDVETIRQRLFSSVTTQ
ncbi:MAG: chromosomal replication initiator protein DnaA [Candidatus Dormibacteria bacterium]